jgi:hypothetical protein
VASGEIKTVPTQARMNEHETPACYILWIITQLQARRPGMKRKLTMLLIAVIAITALNNSSRVTCRATTPQKQIAGGYSETPTDDRDAVAAAHFAIQKERQQLHARISLVSIKRAEVQVVAGLNYRLCMTVKVKGKTRDVTVVVYKNLKQKYSLTSWTADECKEK